ncbi:MAG: enoyl-CoA hydratase-related protein [Pseudomonadota bacterium]
MTDGIKHGIHSRLEGAVWVIGIQRPDKRNALTGAMFAALAETLRLAQGDARVHALLLHGTDDCFCAGHDLRDFGVLWPQAPDGAVVRCIEAFATQPKPLVAAVNGPAVGFGATLLLHADHVVAGDDAVFRFPFVDLGIVPEAGATALLARRVGELRARDWLLSGRPVDSREALRRGLVSQRVAAAKVLDTAMERAALLARKNASATTAIRRMLQAGSTDTAEGAIGRELAALNQLIPAAWHLVPHA